MSTHSPNESKGNILLVDDLPENLQLLSELLKNLGYTVRSVTSGKMALKTVKAKRPDIILLDVKMPEMDGYQVCKAFKADPELADIPILFISALGETFDKLTAFQVGGVDYITKPFQIEEVVARLETQLTLKNQKKILETEISRRKEAEEILYQSRALLSSILNSSLDGIAAMQAVRDPRTGQIGSFLYLTANPVFSQLFEKTHQELIGQTITPDLFERFLPNLFEYFVQVTESGEPWEDDFFCDSKGVCWYHYIAVKLGDGFAVTVRDITLRKRTELALQNANAKLETLAHLDGLTQIANRRRFDTYLNQEWARHQRQQQPLALIMIDIDCFKRFNDANGHQAGDDCLVQVAQAIARTVQRPTDLVVRYGGEEFAVILCHTDAAGAIAVATTIQAAIATLAILHPSSEVSDRVTLSLGVASLVPAAEQRLTELITQADQALYQAKQQGRNRAIVYSADLEE